jgi:hypothetical protein
MPLGDRRIETDSNDVEPGRFQPPYARLRQKRTVGVEIRTETKRVGARNERLNVRSQEGLTSEKTYTSRMDRHALSDDVFNLISGEFGALRVLGQGRSAVNAVALASVRYAYQHCFNGHHKKPPRQREESLSPFQGLGSWYIIFRIF